MDSPEQGCNNAFLCTKPHVPLRQLPQLKEEEPMGYKAIAAEEVEMAAAVAVAEEDELPCNSWHEFANQRESNTNNIWNIQLFSSMTVSLIQDLSKTVVSKNKPQNKQGNRRTNSWRSRTRRRIRNGSGSSSSNHVLVPIKRGRRRRQH